MIIVNICAIQEKYQVAGYDWDIISWFPFIALISGWVGLTSSIWHVSPLAAIIFGVGALIMGVFCGIYYQSLGLKMVRRVKEQQDKTESDE